MTQTILIAGASGGVGRRAAEAFRAAGWNVRLYDRRTDMAEAARGCDVIFNGMNPPRYHNWAEEIPRITRQVIAAARASGATLLVPGNVYVYGDQPGPWSEATPHTAGTRKGRVRAEMERTYRAAAKDGVRTILLRAGDFIDAGNPQTIFRMIVTKGIAKDRITATGNPASPRAYAYLPDLARAFVLLAERRESLAPYEEIGFPGLTFSFDDLAAEIGRQTGRKVRVGRFAWPLITLASPFWELARELREMRYLHTLPHRIDGAKFHRLLQDFEDTAFSRVVAAHLPQALPAGSAAFA